VLILMKKSSHCGVEMAASATNFARSQRLWNEGKPGPERNPHLFCQRNTIRCCHRAKAQIFLP